MSRADPLLKRAIDVGVSSSLLWALAPVLAGVATVIKLDSQGPALFRQERVGQGGRPFQLIKFRTMRPAEEGAGPQVTAGGDPRVTQVGRLLRATKLDELPQLWNVLVGEMSLVGPRPEVPRYVELFAEDYREILEVKPGVTDEATITYRSEEAVLAGADDPERKYVEEVLPHKITFYKEYVRDHSLGKDLSIMWKTLLKIVMP